MLAESTRIDLTASTYGLVSLALFCIAYLLVVFEEKIHLRKSKPVVIAAGILWLLTALAYAADPVGSQLPSDHMEHRVNHHAGEFAGLFLFLMVAMTYISAIANHNVFLKINAILVSKGFGFRTVFWTTGALSFLISPIADNLTTALLMGAVVISVGRGNMRFISMACINVVVAANAGGAFSPFGDITTLMVWAKAKVATPEFFQLVVPSTVNWLVPAVVMHFFVPQGRPQPLEQEAELREGWLLVVVLFLLTIATAVTFHMKFHLPPFLGMTTGLGYFFLYGWFRQRRYHKRQKGEPLDVFKNVADVEWDTMLFFLGVIMCVGALQEVGYLTALSGWLFDPVQGVGPDWANVGVGVLSAIVDNVPVMFAVLAMDPPFDHVAGNVHDVLLHTPKADYYWLQVTLTAGVGGSLLSVGSAAGVALMGSAHGIYTFGRHIVWLPVIALGYVASIVCHWLLNAPPGAA